jgi:hypothetical protein
VHAITGEQVDDASLDVSGVAALGLSTIRSETSTPVT